MDRIYKGSCIFSKEGVKIIGTFPSGNLSDIYDPNVSISIKWDKEGQVFERNVDKLGSGMSKEYYKNGSYFEGNLRRGSREGKGKLVFHNEMYEGLFRDN